MWNNIIHGNTEMNRFERLMEHKGHLERLANIKKAISTNSPKTPSFIRKKMINLGRRKEYGLKIKYENKIIYNRMYEINKKKSPYSPCLNIPKKCPAYELLAHHRSKKKDIIKIENNKLYHRFISARPTYNLLRLQLEKEYKYSKYLEKNISQNNNRSNPNLEFVSFGRFNQNVRNHLFYEKTKRKLNNGMALKYKERPQTCYNNSNKILRPNLTFEYYNNNLKNEFMKTEFSSDNNIIKNYIFDKPKIERPHSCKPKIIINREIQNNSEIIYHSEQIINNSSKKINRNKPASGKTRTNGSYSTNIMTSP